MTMNAMGKRVVLIGATGGLGGGMARVLVDHGAKVILAGRSLDKLGLLKDELLLRRPSDLEVAYVDTTDTGSIEAMALHTYEVLGGIDWVINMTGYDARKSLLEHTEEEIKKSFDLNAIAPINITKAFLPYMSSVEMSRIVHIGGFADGGLAFPYYSADVATRSALFGFTESINRELELEGVCTRVVYFCPSPAHTAAEAPFHELWRQMDIRIVETDDVAKALLETLKKDKTVGIMGGKATVLFAKLNRLSPKLADKVMMNRYGRMLKSYLGEQTGKVIQVTQGSGVPQKKGMTGRIALFLVVLSCIFYAALFIVPCLPLSLAAKGMTATGLIVAGEAAWWIGVAIAGKELVTKYRHMLNPCSWFAK